MKIITVTFISLDLTQARVRIMKLPHNYISELEEDIDQLASRLLTIMNIDFDNPDMAIEMKAKLKDRIQSAVAGFLINLEKLRISDNKDINLND